MTRGRPRNATGQKRSWPDCRHCQKRSGCRCRGLCNRCWSDLTIRAQYGPVSKHGTVDNREPTMAELDAIEAEQRKRLPSWWTAEATRHDRYARGKR